MIWILRNISLGHLKKTQKKNHFKQNFKNIEPIYNE